MGGRPYIVVIGGPNGAGKSTIARSVIEQTIGMTEFVNADTIAAGLSAFEPEASAFAAGRIMLERLKELAAARQAFAFESTLASRTFAPWLSAQKAGGYDIHLVYVALASPAMAIARIRQRVKAGGHDIPGDTVRRRFFRSASNLLDLYLPLALTWRIYDNSAESPLPSAERTSSGATHVYSPKVWSRLHAQASKTRHSR